ncbi:hypothetical protein [Gordonia alkaliphila]|uniref:Uncharacterized protein n=1 Tax=Gordonia alkaliphila TaxID=1053547 RepID=A0ABP8Z4I7_9ACTN
MGKRNTSKPSILTSRAFLMALAALAILVAGIVIGASGVKAPQCGPVAVAAVPHG